MEKTIRYNNYSANISTLGAELISLYKDDENILWTRDKNYWGDSALVLFPFIGRNYDDTYSYKNKEYNIGIHGFAFKSEFAVIEEKEDSLSLLLNNNEETYSIYPFKF